MEIEDINQSGVWKKMMCLTCQWKLGNATPMALSDDGIYVCNVCGTTKVSRMAPPVLLVRSGISNVLFVGGFMLLLLVGVVFDAYPQMETPLTWTMLYSLYLIYFGLAFANFRRKVYA